MDPDLRRFAIRTNTTAAIVYCAACRSVFDPHRCHGPGWDGARLPIADLIGLAGGLPRVAAVGR